MATHPIPTQEHKIIFLFIFIINNPAQGSFDVIQLMLCCQKIKVDSNHHKLFYYRLLQFTFMSLILWFVMGLSEIFEMCVHTRVLPGVTSSHSTNIHWLLMITLWLNMVSHLHMLLPTLCLLLPNESVYFGLTWTFQASFIIKWMSKVVNISVKTLIDDVENIQIHVNKMCEDPCSPDSPLQLLRFHHHLQ